MNDRCKECRGTTTHKMDCTRGRTPEWSCKRCGSTRWVGYRAGPAFDGPYDSGYPRRAQCVPCGHVQALPEGQR